MVLESVLDVPSTDADDARRRKLLNIILIGMAALVVVALGVTFVVDIAGLGTSDEVVFLYLGSVATLAGLFIVFLLNRYGPGWLASIVFLTLLTAALATTDSPQEVVNGRSLFTLAIPVLMASVLLRPWASFVMAALNSLLITFIALSEGIVPNIPAMLGFFAVALISWLSARSLETALSDLRRSNLELDRRVEERTGDLTLALARESAEASKSQAILEGIADGVIVFDTDGKAIVANPAVGRILDRPSSEILGRSIQTLMGKDVALKDRTMVADLLQEQELHRSSVNFGWGDKTLSVSFAPVRDSSGDVSGAVAAFRDYSREQEIARLKSDFVSIVSHELRTPLTSIKGYLDLLIMGATDSMTKQQVSFLEIARNNAERLHELVSDLLDISRIESGKVELNVKVVSMPDLAARIANSLRPEFEHKGLTLALDVPYDLPEVFGDPRRISQILTNLLGNAAKYTRAGGATVRVRAEGAFMRVEVIDTGVGISEENQENLFTRFFRADDTAIRQQPGTGLGLNITRSLVELHGGEVTVESEPDKGSTFAFTLPLPAGLVEVPMLKAPLERPEYIPAPSATPIPMPAPTMLPSGPWVLVVDDDPDVSNLFKFQLAKKGYRVTVVNQGSRAVKVARQLQPELITLDLLMDVDGLAVLSELKSDPTTADIPVIVVSVIPEAEDGLMLGAADYLVKPLDEARLFEAIGRLLKEHTEGGRHKILVVDDEIDIVGWLKHSLTHFGYQVDEAYDGIQCLEAVDADLPDLIILDMKMPRMDGRTTIRRLREREDTRDIPIIVLSAHLVADEAEKAAMSGLGVTEMLSKPVTIEQLVTEVQKHLPRAEGQALEAARVRDGVSQ